MFWKNWPYWLRGGMIVLGVVALSVVVILSIPPKINWDARESTIFQVSEYEIFKKYGYDDGSYIAIQDYVSAISNASSDLFVAPTLGIFWMTQGDKILSDLSKGYPVSSIMVFNKDLTFFRLMPLPKATDSCCVAKATWLGDRYILAHEFIPGVYSPESGNYFYVGDTASSSIRVFETIPVPDNLKRKNNLDVSFSSHPNKNIAVLSYCLNKKESYGNHCSKYGFAIATPERIEEVITKDTKNNNFRVGWDDSNLYIQESNQESEIIETYKVSLARYKNDRFTQTLTENPEPGVKGEPVWMKVDAPAKQKFNFISFDIDFQSSSTVSRGFLTVLLDGETVGEVYEEQEPVGMHNKRLYFKERKPGTYTLELNMVPLNPTVKSTLDVSNASFGYLEFGNE